MMDSAACVRCHSRCNGGRGVQAAASLLLGLHWAEWLVWLCRSGVGFSDRAVTHPIQSVLVVLLPASILLCCPRIQQLLRRLAAPPQHRACIEENVANWDYSGTAIPATQCSYVLQLPDAVENSWTTL